MPKEDIDLEIENQTEREVVENFNKACLYDPLPSIFPALLNHTDIKKYIYTAGILFPYNFNNLTGATYKIPLLGDIYYWERNAQDQLEKKHIILDNESIKTHKKITLYKNSIMYVHISTTFRVPYYLVYRFNLTVSLAHKGLLLGTGPIVDPGFEGRIMIPIHNLTANDYELEAGSGLIRVEFTKLSPDAAFDIKNNILLYDYKYKFPDKGKYWDEYEYFKNINENRAVISSIPEVMKEAEKSAKQAENKALEISNFVKKAGWIAIIALIAGIIYPTWTLINDINIASTKLIENNEKMSLKIENLEKELKNIKNEKKIK